MLNSPRRSPRVAPRDPHAIDVAWALGCARDWLLGPTPLMANLALFVFAALGAVLWQLSRHPDRLDLPGWVTLWAVLVALHAGAVVTYGALRAWRSPRRGPVYYHDIPPEARRSARPAAATPRAVGATATPTDATSRPTWQGALAPVTPFPARRDGDRTATGLPAAPHHDDVRAVHHDAASGMPERPAMASPDSALADVREVLASDQPLWRRWRRRPTPATAGGSDAATVAGLDVAGNWLSPFPGAPPVTRPGAAATADETDGATEPGRAAPPAHWPGPRPQPRTSDDGAADSADGDQLPSLAAMLRSNKLTTLADAPLAGSQPRSPSDAAPAPAPMPTIPTLLPRSTPDAPRPGTAALFAAFGIDGDAQPAAGPDGTDARRRTGPTDDRRTSLRRAAPPDRSRVNCPPDAR